MSIETAGAAGVAESGGDVAVPGPGPRRHAGASVASTEKAAPGRAAARAPAVLRTIRRVHMFAGLFMTPWVLLYGVSAFLFNHPGAMAPGGTRAVAPTEVTASGFGSVPAPESLAARVVAALNARAVAEGRAGGYRLEPGGAAYSADLSATLRGTGQQHTLRVDLAAKTATVRAGADAMMAKAPFATKETLGVGPAAIDLEAGAAGLARQLGLPAGDVALRTVPDLVFEMQGDGRPWRVTYSLKDGGVSAKPQDAPRATFSARTFMTRLHKASGYDRGFDVTWLWALLVDAMFLLLVFWGVSGILMWWQLRALRGWGAATLLASALVAAALGSGMHTRFFG